MLVSEVSERTTDISYTSKVALQHTIRITHLTVRWQVPKSFSRIYASDAVELIDLRSVQAYARKGEKVGRFLFPSARTAMKS